MKKIISLLTILCLLLGTALPSFAEEAAGGTSAAETVEVQDVTEDTEEPEIQEDPENPETPEKSEKTEPVDSEIVAEMYICATAITFTGHLWLYFVNTSEYEIPIGYVSIKPGETMSVGSLSYFRKPGPGTYYNSEALKASDLEKVCRHTTSLEKDLTYKELKKVNEKIKSLNFFSFMAWNCGSFATTVWNSVSNHKFVHVIFPVVTIFEMLLHGGKRGAVLMERPRQNEDGTYEVYKQKRKTVVRVDADSFKTSIVG